jgi:cytochrome c55X
MTLKGGLGKPLLPENLAMKPDAWLKAVILNGVPGTAMPPWKGILSEADADQMVRLLRGETARSEVTGSDGK